MNHPSENQIGYITTELHNGLFQLGQLVTEGLRANGWPQSETEIPRQVIALGEEAGETLGAFRRYLGMARRVGTKDEAAGELMDLIVTAAVLAYMANIDTWEAMLKTVNKIFDRPWKEA